MANDKKEKELQEKFGIARTGKFKNYTGMLKYFQAQACIENCPGPVALDLACGDGIVTRHFLNHYERLVGVDASSFRLQHARKRCQGFPNVEFVESLIEDFNTDEKFNSIFLINVIEHVRNPVDMLAHISNFLKEDGVLCVHVPNANAINRKLALLMGSLTSLDELSPYDFEVGHRRYYTLNTLIKDVENAGLKVVKTGGVLFKILSSPQMDWFLENGLWKDGGYGWGRVGEEKSKDWKKEFCRASYELGKEYPEECNCVYVCATR